MTIYWTNAAALDVKQILLHLRTEKMDHLVANTKARIKGVTNKLLKFPNIGRMGTIEGTRELVMPDMPFIIVYRVGKNIEILRVWHTSRMPYLK